MGVKYAVNEHFFQKWTPEMAYLLGFIYADGCVYESARGHYLMIASNDRFVLERAKVWMHSEHSIQAEPPTSPNGHERYRLRIGNEKLYNTLLDLGIYPNKSLTVRMPFIPREFRKYFILGNFDGDGCVHLSRSKGKTQDLIIRKLTVIFTSGSDLFLYDLLSMLRREMVLNQKNVYSSRRCYQLRFGTKDSMEIFKFMYDNTPKELFFMRKYEIFEKYFALRPMRIDEKVESILHC